jgi:GNAT superfamily N-acetyltransferase
MALSFSFIWSSALATILSEKSERPESTHRRKQVVPPLTIEIRPIRAADTFDLRQRVLRPTDPLSLHNLTDTRPGALHVGCFLNGHLVGIGSIVPEPRPSPAPPTSWRVRGMAVVEEARGIGAGGMILRALIDHASAQPLPAEIWCHGRVSARGFYERFGFAQEGVFYDRPGTGPHALMVKTLWEPC